ncbi:hypothetical protein M0R72_21020 [Candidatus Pacearchaeota archaeon]|jgi:hypothetical protein|nr:hypothetical protein [Candidatus Pacearchaeota archaeon]
MQDEIDLARKWLRYFARPSRHWAPRSCEEYAKRITTWAGEPVRTEALVYAASQLHYEIQGDRIKAAIA